MLGRIERYVLLRTVLGCLAALAAVGGVVMLVDFVEQSRTVGVRAQTSVLDTFGLTLLRTPALILTLLPFVFLFGSLSAFVALNRRNELIAMRAAGVSAWRFIMPAAVVAFLVGVATTTALNPAAADLSTRYEQARERLLRGYLQDAEPAVWVKQGDERNQMVFRARESAVEEGVVVLRGVSVFRSVRDGQGRRFAGRIESREARLLPGRWVLIDAQLTTPGGATSTQDQMVIQTDLDGRSALERFAAPESVPFWALQRTIERTERAGFSATGYRLQQQALLGIPVLFAGMAILAAAFSLRLIRLGGLAFLAGSAVTLGFGFFFLSALCNALGRADILPAPVAAWIPPGLTLLSGVTLLFYTEEG